jgi:hypothetical protein
MEAFSCKRFKRDQGSEDLPATGDQSLEISIHSLAQREGVKPSQRTTNKRPKGESVSLTLPTAENEGRKADGKV